jgi:cysteine-rich repeat protein
MKKLFLFFYFIALWGCNDPCDPSEPADCQGEVLVTCSEFEGFLSEFTAERREPCGTGTVCSESVGQVTGRCSFCGDGQLDPEHEACDPNDPDSLNCRANCTLPECGDGVVDSGELCDDGNTLDNDGCNSDCSGTELCGDQILDLGEECDDGNQVDGDACDSNCTLPFCGNGVVALDQNGAPEQCDDGNNTAGDGCRPDCRGTEVCGDNFQDPSEDCDDGNLINGDTCESDCSLPGCGNRILDQGEACDDGNTSDGDGCSGSCLHLEICGNGILDPQEDCDFLTTTLCETGCTLPVCGNSILDIALGELCDDGPGGECRDDCLGFIFCGDDIVDAGEECDDGNAVNGDSCENGCLLPRCGNGIVDQGEACDDGNTVNGGGCNANCTRVEICGDGVQDPGELCDDGNNSNGDGCQNDCSLPTCGDAIVDSGEQCDDGNNNTLGDGCRNGCTAEVCGDGIPDPQEPCEDGNVVDGDGCDTFCQQEFCGDGIVNTTTEQCDDGNTVAGDGCNAICRDEFCRDGIVNNSTEQCDDNNAIAGDGCRSDCTIEQCNDGILDPGEICLSNIAALALPNGANPRGGVAENINADGRLDLVVANQGSNSFSVFLGNGNQTFQTRFDVSVGQPPTSISSGDFDRDGKSDLVVTKATANEAAILFGNGVGAFTSLTISQFSGSTFPRDVFVADFTNDGLLDFVTANTANSRGKIVRQDSTVSDARSLSRFLSLTDLSGLSAATVVAGDIDNNGVLDVVFGDPSQGLTVFLGSFSFNPNPSLAYSFALAPSQPLSNTSSVVVLADVDLNGSLDIVANDAGNSLVRFLGNGTGAFSSKQVLSSQPLSISDIAVADLEGDGSKEIIVADPTASKILIFSASGVLRLSRLLSSPPSSLVVGEFNGDGLPDIMAISATANNVIPVFSIPR